MRKIKIINMLRKIRIIVFLLPLSLTILFNSCATEDEVGNEEAKEKSLVITNINLEKLKTESLSIYQSSDFSMSRKMNKTHSLAVFLNSRNYLTL